MKHLDLFTGMLGNTIAAKYVWGEEHENVAFCEIDPFCQNVIKKFYPNARIFSDIRTLNPTEIGPVDLITGGVPCQPASGAGKRKGEDDDRWLWPRTLEIVFALRPRYVLLENVSGLLDLKGGLAFEDILSQMEGEGYETVPLYVPASGVGTPQLRYRTWIVAYSSGVRLAARGKEPGFGGGQQDSNKKGQRTTKGYGPSNLHKEPTDPDRDGHRRPYGSREDRHPAQENEGKVEGANRKRIRDVAWGVDAATASWEEWWYEAATRLCTLADGLPDRLVRLPDGRKISGARWRKESLKAIGNSIVPQVAIEIFKAIKEVESTPAMI